MIPLIIQDQSYTVQNLQTSNGSGTFLLFFYSKPALVRFFWYKNRSELILKKDLVTALRLEQASYKDYVDQPTILVTLVNITTLKSGVCTTVKTFGTFPKRNLI